MRDLLFTLCVTCISKLIYLHDRLLRRVDFQRGHLLPGFSRCAIPNRNGTLDAVLAMPVSEPVRHAVLICHGIGETVEYWSEVQRLLAEDGVASLVFNYSGYGRSSGRIAARQCERDAVTAFAWLREQVPADCPVSLLGFSMGTGIATAIAAEVHPQRLVLCAGYTSFREAAVSIGWPKWLAWMAPDIWDNCKALRKLSIPALIVHGERDQLFPCSMACAVAAACSGPCEHMIVPGLTHAAPLFRAGRPYWHAIATYLHTTI